ncbi:hypothetical protein XENORESO_011929 [Xenotaenia resolanae]|uniref:Uncharacterized protein n=1 Tax=Xenotaenia resolanae TaxID=208358 RepID=A0ABV0VSS3_9TELE
MCKSVIKPEHSTHSCVLCCGASAVWVTKHIMSCIHDCFNCTWVCVYSVCVVLTGGLNSATSWGSGPVIRIIDMMSMMVSVCPLSQHYIHCVCFGWDMFFWFFANRCLRRFVLCCVSLCYVLV